MDRLAKENLVVAHDRDKGFVFDVATNTMLKSSIECIKYIKQLQEAPDEKEKEYKEMQKYLDNRFSKIQTTIPTHPNSFISQNLNKLTVMVSNACNLRCKYCYAGYGDFNGYGNRIMNGSDAVRYIDALITGRFRNIENLQFFGGEPLLGIGAIVSICEHFKTLFQYNKIESIPKYSMVSNFTIMNETIKKVIEKYNISVTVSLDGPEEINDCLRVFPDDRGTYKLISNHIWELKKNVKSIEATYTKMHTEAGWTMKDLREYIQKKFLMPKELIKIVPAIGDNKYCYRENDDPPDDELHIDLDNVYVLRMIKYKYQNDLFCNAGFNSLALMENGDLYPCHMYALDRKFLMGTYNRRAEEPYENIGSMSQRAYKEMSCVKKSNHIECEGCWLRNICHSCPANKLISGEYGKIKKERCRKKKQLYKELMLSIL